MKIEGYSNYHSYRIVTRYLSGTGGQLGDIAEKVPSKEVASSGRDCEGDILQTSQLENGVWQEAKQASHRLQPLADGPKRGGSLFGRSQGERSLAKDIESK